MQIRFLLPTLFGCLLVASAAQGQSYPDKPITLIIPFPPGGSTDIIARVVGDRLAKELGKPVVIENRGGAGGAIGAAAIAKAEPDGYTIGISTVSTHAVNPACNPKIGYDPIKDFAPISTLARSPNVLAVNPKFGVEDFKQFMDVVKKSPGKYGYASSGNCGLAHMLGEQFKSATGTHILHVAYRGIGPALNDVLGGQVEMIFDNVPSSLPHIKSGKLKPLAVAWHKRLESLPMVPTFGELGLNGVNDPAWYGLIAPAKTPDEIIKKLNAAAVKALAVPEVQERIRGGGSEPVGSSAAEHAKEIQAEFEKMKNIVKKQGIKMEGA
ncbi:MAG TPA: tripartite tricarboxylate transporter substrate binding protein BugE [Noviherbaspirillum sp.]|jgi:tripartite-type tricarboxylate transporter receptor subunit TctC|uniref:tripartite tricarboxylate transporter substrate binding protein BugE n=1 Tax=Noviherbaspirillum sp. TaxID=1926288 RepID=UPI002F94552C